MERGPSVRVNIINTTTEEHMCAAESPAFASSLHGLTAKEDGAVEWVRSMVKGSGGTKVFFIAHIFRVHCHFLLAPSVGDGFPPCRGTGLRTCCISGSVVRGVDAVVEG